MPIRKFSPSNTMRKLIVIVFCTLLAITGNNNLYGQTGRAKPATPDKRANNADKRANTTPDKRANTPPEKRVNPSLTNGKLILPAKGLLRIENLRGNVQIYLTSRPDIEILAQVPIRKQAAQANELEVADKSDQISLATRPTELNNPVDLKITAPLGTALRLYSQQGNIEVTGAEANMMARTRRGNITINLANGSNIDVDLTSSEGTLQLSPNLHFYGTYDAHSLFGRIGEGGSIFAGHTERGQIAINFIASNDAAAQNELPQNESAKNESIKPNLPVPTQRADNRADNRNSGGAISSNNSNNRSNNDSLKNNTAKNDNSSYPKNDNSRNNSSQNNARNDSPGKDNRSYDEDDYDADRGSDGTIASNSDTPPLRPRSTDAPKLRLPGDEPDDTIDNGVKDSTGSTNNKEDDGVLRIESKLVTVNANALQRSGRPLTDLRKENFHLYEDRVEQEIVHFQSTESPFNMILLIDLSGSLKEKLDLIRRAALRFVRAARPTDKVAIVTFSSKIRIACNLTSNREELRRGIENIREPEGGTNFYDAMESVLNKIVSQVPGERNAIVVMSDGVDNMLPGIPGEGSKISFNAMSEHIQEADTLVFPIFIDTEQELVDELGQSVTRAYAIARSQLKELADATGGGIYYAQQVTDLEGCYEAVAADLRTIYSLGYYPSNSEHDNTFRRIQVKVDRDDAQVRARRGYYAK